MGWGSNDLVDADKTLVTGLIATLCSTEDVRFRVMIREKGFTYCW
jgi:hypothetical protein